MASSPLSASPYEVLGVKPTATDDELKRAYRARLRAAHPDTGGEARDFHAVQAAWMLIGTPDARARFDLGRPTGAAPSTFAARPAQASGSSRPSARSYGHPGGWRRERYLTLLREWVGRGVDVPNPYDPALVRNAPRDIRHILADALAEEATSRIVSELGIAFTVWHDVATDSRRGAEADSSSKLDHIVLGPTGLFAVLSEDWGGPVRVRKNELVGEAIGADKPFFSLALRTKAIARAARVRFTALIIVVPDGEIESAIVEVKVRGYRAFAVERSSLARVLKNGIDSDDPIGGNELFDARTRLQQIVRFV